MKIAIASSGLGHVARGIETWALDTAVALAGRGVDVTLFGGEGSVSRVEDKFRVVALSGLKRTDRKAAFWARALPGFTWRWGMKDTYGLEQFCFWRRLEPKLRDGGFDVLHVQDPMLAFWCRRARNRGRIRTKEILAHGTEERIEFLRQFDHVQHLAPWHMEQALNGLRKWCAIPNFVDTAVFRPAAGEEEKRQCRRELGIPEDAFVIGTAAAVKKHHKRIDYLLKEFAMFNASRPHSHTPVPPHLVIAGSRQKDTEELTAIAKELAGDSVRVLLDLSRERMPGFYRALDVFVLTSLFEMMPIAVLEALASGVPVIANRHPVLQWMVGEREGTTDRTQCAEEGVDTEPGGMTVDMAQDGGLSGCLRRVDNAWCKQRSTAARRRALSAFSREVIVDRYVAYYRRVMAGAEDH